MKDTKKSTSQMRDIPLEVMAVAVRYARRLGLTRGQYGGGSTSLPRYVSPYSMCPA